MRPEEESVSGVVVHMCLSDDCHHGNLLMFAKFAKLDIPDPTLLPGLSADTQGSTLSDKHVPLARWTSSGWQLNGIIDEVTGTARQSKQKTAAQEPKHSCRCYPPVLPAGYLIGPQPERQV
ncbi:hypothetical protein NHX12_002512 [Muraenolepis orangiensis]|uniref:Uncharacterized protein n=1 Tax=Muraenolepis orangiensis TaxID=630683 RepID=A0A9Q0DYZ4_9TELE|nr:hypothetical protein NHX12_002512 [Muraenolepis orangiensis]